MLIKYAPNIQTKVCNDAERCVLANTPTLAEINRDYDKLAAVAWLIPQLTNIAEFSNCQATLNKNQIRECAEMIVAEYYYLKLSELLLFFYRFKQSRYKQFYGFVSPMAILSSLPAFIRERNTILEKDEAIKREERYKENKEKAVSYEEYLKLKKTKQV